MTQVSCKSMKNIDFFVSLQNAASVTRCGKCMGDWIAMGRATGHCTAKGRSNSKALDWPAQRFANSGTAFKKLAMCLREKDLGDQGEQLGGIWIEENDS